MTMENAQRAVEGTSSDELPSIRMLQADAMASTGNGPLPSISHLFATVENPTENPLLAASRESSLGPIRSRPLSSTAYSNSFRHDPSPQLPQSPRWLNRSNTPNARLALRRLESSGSIASVASAASSHDGHPISPVLSPLSQSVVRHRNPTSTPLSDEAAPNAMPDDQGRRGSVTRRHTVGAADVPRNYISAAVADLKDSSSASECGFERSERAEGILSAMRSGAAEDRDGGYLETPLTPTGRSRIATSGASRPPMEHYNPFKANQIRSINRKRGLLGEHGSAAAPYSHRGVPSCGGSVYSHTSSIPSLSVSTASTRSTTSASVSTTSLSSVGPSSQSSWSVHSRSSTLDDLEVHLDAQHLDPNYDRGLQSTSPKPFLPPRSSSLHLRNQAKRDAEDAARREALLNIHREYERQDSPVSVRSAPHSWGPSSPRFGHIDAHHNAAHPYQQRPDSRDSSHSGMHPHTSSLFALANAANSSARGPAPRCDLAPTPRLPLRMSSRVDGQQPYRDWEAEGPMDSKYYHSQGLHHGHPTSPPLLSSSSSAYSVLSPYSSSPYRALPPPSIRSSTSSFPSPHGSFISLASAPAALPTNQHYGGPPPSSAAAKYECATCGKRFTRPSSLKIHMHSHTGERPFGCSCGRKFSVHSNLRRHQKAHGHVAATGLDEEVMEADAEEADAEAEDAINAEEQSPQHRSSEGDSEHTPTEELGPKAIVSQKDADDGDARMRSRSPSPIDDNTYTSPSAHSSAGIDVEFEDAQTGVESASSPEDHHAKHFKRSLGLSEETDPRACS